MQVILFILTAKNMLLEVYLLDLLNPQNIKNVTANGMVIDPKQTLEEFHDLTERG